MSSSWYVEHRGKIVGPLSSTQLKQLASEQKIVPDTKVRLGEDGEWTKASKVKGLFDQLTAPKSTATIATAPEKMQVIAQPATKDCPMCGELIAASAIKCRHCNEFLDGRPREQHVSPQPAPQAMMATPAINVTQVTNFNMNKRFSPLLAAFLSFLIPGLGQLYKGQPINGAIWFVVVIIGYVALIVPGIILHVCCIAGAAMGNPYR